MSLHNLLGTSCSLIRLDTMLNKKLGNTEGKFSGHGNIHHACVLYEEIQLKSNEIKLRVTTNEKF